MDSMILMKLDVWIYGYMWNWMVDFTYGMTLVCDLASSQWMGWKSGFLCGLFGVIATQFVTLDGIKMGMVI